MIESRKCVENNVFISFYLDDEVIGRLYTTYHPTIPYEVYRYINGNVESKRVNTEEEAIIYISEGLQRECNT